MNRLNLKPETVNKLQSLYEINLDSHKGFSQVADVVDDPRLKSIFRHYAEQRLTFARQLSSYIRSQGESTDDSGTFKGKVHRWWISLRTQIQGNDPEIVLKEARRGEDSIKSLYEEVILETTGNPVNDVLHLQYEHIVKSWKKMEALQPH